jgi:hypothetical protein
MAVVDVDDRVLRRLQLLVEHLRLERRDPCALLLLERER